jgi:hypothetical protein
MKYAVAVFVTAILVFLGATVYYKGLPTFPQYSKNNVSTQSGLPVETNETFASPSATPAAKETAKIIAEIRAALIAKHGQNAAALNVTVSKIEGEYAKGGASGEGGGGMWFAARLNGKWTLVWDGNGIITCNDVSPYPEFPADMIPECWDTSTNKMVTR